jgi:uncharacterized protein YceK
MKLARYSFLMLLFVALVLSGCATTFQLESGKRTPAAEGTMEVTEDENDNYILDIRVAHLPEPKKLDENLTTYVVWANPVGSKGEYSNLGRLKLNEDREGRMSARTPFKDFDIIVTAEKNAAVDGPSKYVVLKKRIKL